MKNRKNLMILISVIVIGITGMILFSCEYEKELNNPRTIVEGNSFNATKDGVPIRIHILEFNIDSHLRIVEVDGHEYLVNNDGGIYHLESCPCKK